MINLKIPDDATVSLTGEQFQDFTSRMKNEARNETFQEIKNMLGIHPNQSFTADFVPILKNWSYAILQPASEWHEDFGTVLWWDDKGNLNYTGTPLDSGWLDDDCLFFTRIPNPITKDQIKL